MKTIQFYALGLPKGQPRARAFAKKGLGVRMYDPATAEGWKGQVASAAAPHRPETPLTGPLLLILCFHLPRPQKHYRTGKRSAELRDDAPLYHTGKPDVDNFAKAIMDAMTQLAFWQDDAQVASCVITKTYINGRGPGCEITLEQLGPLPI